MLHLERFMDKIKTDRGNRLTKEQVKILDKLIKALLSQLKAESEAKKSKPKKSITLV